MVENHEQEAARLPESQKSVLFPQEEMKEKESNESVDEGVCRNWWGVSYCWF
jgi:hypothetical protein